MELADEKTCSSIKTSHRITLEIPIESRKITFQLSNLHLSPMLYPWLELTEISQPMNLCLSVCTTMSLTHLFYI